MGQGQEEARGVGDGPLYSVSESKYIFFKRMFCGGLCGSPGQWSRLEQPASDARASSLGMKAVFHVKLNMLFTYYMKPLSYVINSV